jgi:hypothetical protein
LLVQYLAAFGNAVGRGPYFKVEATRQHLNLFVVLVGASSRARKGTAWGHIHELFSSIEEEWAKQCIKRGLSSGEGFAWSVRDSTKKRMPIKDHGRNTGAYEEVVVDEGVDDKRILVIEEEFSSPLQVMKREGNILSATLRCA